MLKADIIPDSSCLAVCVCVCTHMCICWSLGYAVCSGLEKEMKEEWETTWKERVEELSLWFGETRMDVVTLEGGSEWTYVGKVPFMLRAGEYRKVESPGGVYDVSQRRGKHQWL